MTRQQYRSLIRRAPRDTSVIELIYKLCGLPGVSKLEQCFLCDGTANLEDCGLGLCTASDPIALRKLRWISGAMRKPLVGYSICGSCVAKGLGPDDAERMIFAIADARMREAGIEPPPLDLNLMRPVEHDHPAMLIDRIPAQPFEPEDLTAWFGPPKGQPS